MKQFPIKEVAFRFLDGIKPYTNYNYANISLHHINLTYWLLHPIYGNHAASNRLKLMLCAYGSEAYSDYIHNYVLTY